MQKFSESLRELADHAENIEKKVDAAVSESKEKADATLATSKADAKARQSQFKAKVAERNAAGASDWERLQADHNQRMEKIKSTIGAKKDAIDRKVAVRRADHAEDCAASSIDFALMAIDDAEVATLEAVDARAHAESLA